MSLRKASLRGRSLMILLQAEESAAFFKLSVVQAEESAAFFKLSVVQAGESGAFFKLSVAQPAISAFELLLIPDTLS